MLRVTNDIALTPERGASQDEALLALGKSLTDKRMKMLRDSVSPCVVEVDHDIHVQGKFVVHADYEQTQVNKVCPWTFLKVAWDKMNAATRNTCVQEVQQMLRDGVKPEFDDLKEVTRAAVKAVSTDVKQTSRGQCKFNGTIFVQE